MKKFFKFDFRFRTKLLVAFGSILILSAGLISHSLWMNNQLSKYDELKLNFVQGSSELVKISDRFSHFLKDDSKSLTFFQTASHPTLIVIDSNINQMLKVLDDCQLSSLMNEQYIAEIEVIKSGLSNYKSNLFALVDVMHKIGFKDYGMVGELRQTIHEVEDYVNRKDLVEILMLRRHEKDFFLRKDLKYLKKFNNRIDDLIAAQDSSAYSIRIIPLLLEYKSNFNQVVELNRQIGLTEKEGMRGEMYEGFASLTKSYNKKVNYMADEYRNYKSRAILILIIIFVVQFLIGLILSIRYSSRISSAILKIRGNMIMLSKGEFPEALNIDTNDEVSETAEATNEIVERISAAVTFSEELGKGNIEAEYDERYNDDVLAKSIISMQQELKKANAEQKLINWSNQGVAEFNQMIQNDSLKLEELGDAILSFIVGYIGANQGALFMLDKDDESSERPMLERLSTYAYDKKKFVEERFPVGQGLTGQVALEKLPMHLKDVPTDYIAISSGLGQAVPRNIYITPLVVNDEVFGVFELASFDELEKYQLDFIERLTEIIANVLSAKKMTMYTNRLLEETRDKAEIMMQQEEELKQTNEEIQATREDLERQQQELMQENEMLRAQVRQLQG